MQNFATFCVLVVSVVSCNNLPYRPPAGELCVVSIQRYPTLLCDDGVDEYERRLEPKDIVTNPDYYGRLEEYVLEMRKEIQRLRVECR